MVWLLVRYEEKDSEWNRLTKLVEEQQLSLVAAKALQDNHELSSEKNFQLFKDTEEKLASLQEKYQVDLTGMPACIA